MTAPESLLVARQTLQVILPEVLLLLAAVVMMTAGPFVRWPRRAWAAASAFVIVASVVALILVRDVVPDPYSSVALNDALSGYARLFLLLTGLVILGLSHDQVDDSRAPEFFGSILLIHAGGLLVCCANELTFLFVGLEMVSIPTYLLLYLSKRNATTQEAATKYFFLSIFSSALLLFGLAYLYGLTGVSNLKAMAYLIRWRGNALSIPQPQIAMIAVVFIMAGLGFRVAAVPFHWYAPDVYEGSPTVVAALLAWVPKAVGFVALIRVLASVFGWARAIESEVSAIGQIADKAALIAGVIAVATMTLGNTVALKQDNLKRLFAYSSIAHAGYLMMGLAAAFRAPDGQPAGYLGTEAILIYLATYALMTLGAFGVMIALSTQERSVDTIDDLDGLAWTHPAAAVAMGLCLFSLAGVPPMAGFFGKLWVFGATLEAARGEDARAFQALAVIGALNAAIGAYYYLRIVMRMTFSPPPSRPLTPRASWPTVLAVGACSSLSLLLGPLVSPIATVARESAVSATRLDEPIVGTTTAALSSPLGDADPAEGARVAARP